jgi:hypothetical protein
VTEEDPVKIGIDVPPEPVAMTVVIDKRGFAWQRLASLWVRSGKLLGILIVDRDDTAVYWVELLAQHGPVEIVHTPAEAAGTPVEVDP